MILIFINQNAEVVLPTPETLSKALGAISYHEYKLLAFCKNSASLVGTVSGILECAEVSVSDYNGSDSFVPIGSKSFLRDVIKGNSILVNGIGLKASEGSYRAIDERVTVVVCSDLHYVSVDKDSTRVKYPFKPKNIEVLTSIEI